WKGAVADIVPRTIAEMVKLGAKAERLEAFISPCISQARFEVGLEVAEQFPARFVDNSREKPHVDLKGFVNQQLLDAGLAGSSITLSEGCTMSKPDAYYSFRREKQQSGRMMALITIKKI
ncbi:MAG: polyphenol oxidase family protein, partial [Balneolia bacterium]|nr:polyphenol oxidase family protein [Balneolia bacterium]